MDGDSDKVCVPRPTKRTRTQQVEAYVPSPIRRRRRRRPRRTEATIAKICAAIYETLYRRNPMTVRQVFYQLVSQGVVDKTENEYKRTVGRLLLQLRRSGVVPYNWVADNTRWMRRPQTHRSLELALEATVRTYRQMLWDDQPAYVEIWTEKDAIAGVLNEETAKWVVPLMVSRGFSSETFLYEAAETIKAQNKPAFLYYFGDYDPSGLLIDRTIANRLRGFAPAADIHFERVAVTESQIQEWKLPTRPTKKKGSHHKSFVGESVEVDAIDPEVLISLVSGCIRKHIDPRQLAVTTASEEQEKEDFQNFVRLFGSYQNAS